MIIGKVKKQMLQIVADPCVDGSRDYITGKVSFSNDWCGMQKYVHFQLGNKSFSVLLDENGEWGRDAHVNLTAGEWLIWLHGTDGKTVITTNVLPYRVITGGTVNGEPFPEINPSIGEQIVQRATEEANRAADSAQRAERHEWTSAINAGWADERADDAEKAAQKAETAADAAGTAAQKAETAADAAADAANSFNAKHIKTVEISADGDTATFTHEDGTKTEFKKIHDIFVAEYKKTTYDEISEAVDAGKEVICYYDNPPRLCYRLLRIEKIGKIASFSAMYNHSEYRLECINTSWYNYGSSGHENTANKTKTIINNPLLYPTSQAVYLALQKKMDADKQIDYNDLLNKPSIPEAYDDSEIWQELDTKSVEITKQGTDINQTLATVADHENRIHTLEQGGGGGGTVDTVARQGVADLKVDLFNSAYVVTGNVIDFGETVEWRQGEYSNTALYGITTVTHFPVAASEIWYTWFDSVSAVYDYPVYMLVNYYGNTDNLISAMRNIKIAGGNYSVASMAIPTDAAYFTVTISTRSWGKNIILADFVELNPKVYLGKTDIGSPDNFVRPIESKADVAVDRQIKALIPRIADIESDVSTIETNAAARNDIVKCITHRGDSKNAPENTLSAFKYAKDRGFRYVETDIRFTSDGVPVLLHDDTIDRTSNGAGRIDSMTYAQVSAYDFGSWFDSKFAGEKIPTLHQFLIVCRRLGLHPYIELKTTDANQIGVVCNEIKSCGMAKSSTIISYNMSALADSKSNIPSIRLGLIKGPSSGITEEQISSLTALKTDENEVFVDLDSHSDDTTNQFAGALIPHSIPLEVCTNGKWTIAIVHPYVSGITTDSESAEAAFYELWNWNIR